jgi:small subunit ribosomal protein S16
MQRQGRPKKPFYRIVAVDKRARRDGRPIEFLGQYDPMADSDKIKVNQERLDYWLKQGAVPTETLSALLKKKQNPVSEKKSEEPKEKEEIKQEEPKSEE